MEVFVLARVIDGNPVDYLKEDGFSWIESPTVARWYNSEEEAAEDFKRCAARYPVVQLLSYDPLKSLANPTEIDRSVAYREYLQRLTREKYATRHNKEKESGHA
jgi:hypothetical protein